MIGSDRVTSRLTLVHVPNVTPDGGIGVHTPGSLTVKRRVPANVSTHATNPEIAEHKPV